MRVGRTLATESSDGVKALGPRSAGEGAFFALVQITADSILHQNVTVRANAHALLASVDTLLVGVARVVGGTVSAS